MPGIVQELQADLASSTSSVSDILRKAVIVARKLKVDELAVWINKELNGYSNEEGVPPYRIVTGSLVAHHPYSGKIPLIVRDAELEKVFTTKRITMPAAEIEHLLGSRNDAGYFVHTFTSSQSAVLMDAFKMDLVPSLHVPTSHFKRILDRIRNELLDWALKLEENGITGEGLSFSDRDITKAKHSIQNSTVIYGDVSSSQIQNLSPHANQDFLQRGSDIHRQIGELVELLQKQIDNKAIPAEFVDDIRKQYDIVAAEMDSAKPKKSVIHKALSVARDLLMNVTGNLIASGLIYEIAKLLPLLV